MRKGTQGITNVNIELFGKIKTYLRTNDISYSLKEKPYVDTTDDEDDILTKSEVTLFPTGSKIRTALLEYNNEVYLGIYGINVNEDDVDSLRFETMINPINSGLKLTLILEMEIPINKEYRAYDIYNDFLAGPDINPCPIDANLFFDCFENFTILKVISENPKDIYVPKLIGYFMSIQKQSTLHFDENIHDKFFNLFSSRNDYIPSDLLLIAYSAFNYKHVFLELYRTIEYLFPITALEELKSNISIPHYNSIELAKHMEKSINWRPKEDESVIRIFKILDKSILQEFTKYQNEISELKGLEVAQFIYKLRNFNVHYRKALGADALQIKDTTWLGIISTFLDTIEKVYDHYQTELALN